MFWWWTRTADLQRSPARVLLSPLATLSAVLRTLREHWRWAAMDRVLPACRTPWQGPPPGVSREDCTHDQSAIENRHGDTGCPRSANCSCGCLCSRRTLGSYFIGSNRGVRHANHAHLELRA